MNEQVLHYKLYCCFSNKAQNQLNEIREISWSNSDLHTIEKKYKQKSNKKQKKKKDFETWQLEN